MSLQITFSCSGFFVLDLVLVPQLIQPDFYINFKSFQTAAAALEIWKSEKTLWFVQPFLVISARWKIKAVLVDTEAGVLWVMGGMGEQEQEHGFVTQQIEREPNFPFQSEPKSSNHHRC